MNTIIDQHGRNIDYIRISVTDRCNLRCHYCMPEEGVSSLNHEDILRYEEIERICRLGAGLGICKVKLTGGEPLVRKGVTDLVKKLVHTEGIDNVTMTSNGVLLLEYAEELKKAGLSCINISLDTLNRDRFAKITGKNDLDRVISGIDHALCVGLNVRLNCAVMEELPGSEVLDLTEYSLEKRIPLRFIEMMPIGQGRKYNALDNEELKTLLADRYNDLSPTGDIKGNGPAVYYQYAGGKGIVGFISAIHNKFCGECNRVRLTADGYLKLCLAGDAGMDLRHLLRNGTGDEAIKQVLLTQIRQKPACHHFNEADKGGWQETGRNMNEIGG